MEPTQAAPAGFILGGGGVGAGSVGKGTGHFNMQDRTTRVAGPGCPVSLLPLLGQLGGKPGETVMGTQVAACSGPVNSAAVDRCRWPQRV